MKNQKWEQNFRIQVQGECSSATTGFSVRSSLVSSIVRFNRLAALQHLKDNYPHQMLFNSIRFII